MNSGIALVATVVPTDWRVCESVAKTASEWTAFGETVIKAFDEVEWTHNPSILFDIDRIKYSSEHIIMGSFADAFYAWEDANISDLVEEWRQSHTGTPHCNLHVLGVYPSYESVASSVSAFEERFSNIAYVAAGKWSSTDITLSTTEICKDVDMCINAINDAEEVFSKRLEDTRNLTDFCNELKELKTLKTRLDELAIEDEKWYAEYAAVTEYIISHRSPLKKRSAALIKRARELVARSAKHEC